MSSNSIFQWMSHFVRAVLSFFLCTVLSWSSQDKISNKFELALKQIMQFIVLAVWLHNKFLFQIGYTSAETTALSQRLIENLSLKEREIKCICELNDCYDIIKCDSCFTFQHRVSILVLKYNTFFCFIIWYTISFGNVFRIIC